LVLQRTPTGLDVLRSLPVTCGCVGTQSTYFSLIIDSGPIRQLTSCGSPESRILMFITTAAFAWGVGVMNLTVPTLTPPIFTFSPGMRLLASSKIARTV
jgi:hypothetical protein